MFGRPEIPTVAVSDVTDNDYLLDVRDPAEWSAGHAPQAHHVPMMDIPGRLAELPADQDLVVVCRVGSRSAQVVAFLQGQGLGARNLDGGMFAWQSAGRPIVGTDGQPGHVL